MRSGLGYQGARNLAELALKAEMFRMSSAGVAESHPHDVQLLVAPPNYSR
ncbi:MAG: IMP dehydrogenase [Patescibacteria group bacterium]